MQLLKHFHELSIHPKNAKELKGLILQLAVQGKLTAQWRKSHPELVEGDNSATALLEKIKAEKEQLIKEKKIKKEKPLPAISEDEIPYDLPESWIWCRMADLIKISSGNGLTSSQMDKSGDIPVYGGNGITGCHSSFNVDERTIVIGRVGYYCGSIHLTEEKAWITDNAFITKYSKIHIYRNFLFWLLTGTNLKENENATAQPVISGKKVYPIVIALPPLEEQKAIVKTVEQLFAEVEQLEQLTKERIQLKEQFATSALQQLTINNTSKEWDFLQEHFHIFFNEEPNIKKLRETILQLAVQGKLTEHWRTCHPELVEGCNSATTLLEKIKAEKEQLIKDKKIKKENPLPAISENEIPYELPDSWVWEYLGNSMLKITDGTHHSPPNIEKGKFKYVTAKNIKNDGIKLSNITYVTKEVHQEIYARCNPELGDLLYIKDGATTGICCINNLDEEFSMLSSVALIKQSQLFFSDYLLSVFRSPYYYELMRAGMSGVAITRVTLTKLKASIIPIPPLAEQQAIVEKVNSLMALCDSLEQKVKESKTGIEKRMKSVLREVFEIK